MQLGMIFDDAESRRDDFAQGDCDEVFLELMHHLGWLDDLAGLLDRNQLPEPSGALLRLRLDSQEEEETSSDNAES
jgi:hypothetical protein